MVTKRKSSRKLNKIRNRIKLFKPLQDDYCGFRRTDIIITPQKSRHGWYLEIGKGYDLVSFQSFVNKVENMTISPKTLNNYIDKGHVSKGWYIDSRTNQHKHRMYHPFSIVEYLTASRLMSGSWITNDLKNPNLKKFSIARATSQDVFIGRLAFLKNGYAQKLCQNCVAFGIEPFGLYLFDTDNYFKYYEPMNGLWAYPDNHEDAIFSCYDQAKKMLLEQFGEQSDIDAYIAYNEMIYRRTFTFLYNKYIEDIVANSPKSLPEFDGGGFSKPKAESKTPSNSNQ